MIEKILYIAGELVDIFGWTVILLAFVIIDGVFLGDFLLPCFLKFCFLLSSAAAEAVAAGEVPAADSAADPAVGAVPPEAGKRLFCF